MIFYDKNDVNFYVDPASASYLNDVRANIYYDRSNTSYYVYPSSTSIMNDVRANIFYDAGNTSYYVDPASTTVLNDARASIFYDRSNTNYYVDPASNSNLYNLTIGGDVSSSSNQGILWQSGTDYGIFRESGAWSSPYPDLRIAFHTGIKIGANYSYGGTRFYNNSDMATQIFSVGDGDNYVRAYYALYSPILYDQNNTGYYIDPAATSIMNDVRASVFYDADNTSYYIDPASTSITNEFRVNALYDAGNTSYYLDPANSGTSATLAGRLAVGAASADVALDVNGYTQLGSDAPKIKMKKLSGTTSNSQGGTATVSHGLTSTKIIGIQAIVNYSSGVGIIPGFTSSSGYEYDVQYGSSDVTITNNASNSSNILSKSFTVVIIYEE